MLQEKLYIGSKIIRAHPLSECNFLKIVKGEDVSNREDRLGYLVKDPDGHISWSPKDVFETTYREMTLSEKALV